MSVFALVSWEQVQVIVIEDAVEDEVVAADRFATVDGVIREEQYIAGA